MPERRYKLVHFDEPQFNDWEMFDLQTDTPALESLFGDPAHAAEQADRQRRLARLRTESAVPATDPPESARPKR